MQAIRIGTSGYTYSDWKVRFYPPGLPQRRWLSFLSEQFATVEINATFYRSFPKSVYERWANETTDDFSFAIKGPRVVTHLKKLVDCEAELQTFQQSYAGLGNKLHIVLWQFPKSFTANTHNVEKLAAFFTLLPKQRQAVELRDRSWFTPATFDLLDAYNITFTINDTAAFDTTEAVTGSFAYIRFHGPTALYASSYSDRQLSQWAGRIKQLAQTIPIYCYFNNDVSGYAIQNAKQLQAILGKG